MGRSHRLKIYARQETALSDFKSACYDLQYSSKTLPGRPKFHGNSRSMDLVQSQSFFFAEEMQGGVDSVTHIFHN